MKREGRPSVSYLTFHLLTYCTETLSIWLICVGGIPFCTIFTLSALLTSRTSFESLMISSTLVISTSLLVGRFIIHISFRKPIASLGPDAQAEIDRVEAALATFFAHFTMHQLYEQAVQRRLMLAPVADARTILEDPQLAAREFFRPVHSPTLGVTLPLLGP